jgi:hypothetical protein
VLSRRSAKLLADLLAVEFTDMRSNHTSDHIDTSSLYVFVYEADFEPWFCNLIQRNAYPSTLRDFVMKLETGEAIFSATEKWTRESRLQRSRELLMSLADTVVGRQSGRGVRSPGRFRALTASLELDGYQVRDGKLLDAESEANEVEEERGELANHYAELALPNLRIVQNHLNLSEEHYLAGKWGDCIGNSRHYFEQVLEDVADAWSKRAGSPAFPSGKVMPVKIREYLRDAGLWNEDEFQAFGKLYGLLSATGGHPGMSEKDQARIFRRLALSMVQFMLLRYESRINPPS